MERDDDFQPPGETFPPDPAIGAQQGGAVEPEPVVSMQDFVNDPWRWPWLAIPRWWGEAVEPEPVVSMPGMSLVDQIAQAQRSSDQLVFADAVKRALAELGMSADDLAKRVGTDAQIVECWASRTWTQLAFRATPAMRGHVLRVLMGLAAAAENVIRVEAMARERSLVEQLAAARENPTVDRFHDAVARVASELGMSARDIARAVTATVRTVERWLSRAGAPHELTRQAVLAILLRKARMAAAARSGK